MKTDNEPVNEVVEEKANEAKAAPAKKAPVKAYRKTYVVNGPNKTLSRHLKVVVDTPHGKVARYISMKGHLRPKRVKGEFTTTDPQLIAAMDARIENAVGQPDFYCKSEVEIDPSEARSTPIVETTTGEMRFEGDVDENLVKRRLPVDKKSVPGVSRVMDAAAWLRDNVEGVTARDVSNRDKITRLAVANNIEFPDLNLD